jgi:type IV pilus assembly protein PilQ
MSLRAALAAAVIVTAIPLTAHAQSSRREPAKKITIDVQDADIHNVIRLFADVSGKNIVVADDVKGKVTIKLKNVPWDQALSVVLATKSLGYVETANIIRVAPQATLDAEQGARLLRANDCLEKGNLTTRMIPVSYARASDMLPVIKETLTKRGTAVVDERTNTIIVRDVSCP